MAKIKNMVLTLSRKVSDNNYGSYGADVTLEVEVEPGDDVKEVKASLRKAAKKDLDASLELLVPKETEKKNKGAR